MIQHIYVEHWSYISQCLNITKECPDIKGRVLHKSKFLHDNGHYAFINASGDDEIGHEYRLLLLAHSIDSTDPLFQLHRVPMQVVVYQRITKLKVNSFGTDRSHDQNAPFCLFELLKDFLPFYCRSIPRNEERLHSLQIPHD